MQHKGRFSLISRRHSTNLETAIFSVHSSRQQQVPGGTHKVYFTVTHSSRLTNLALILYEYLGNLSL